METTANDSFLKPMPKPTNNRKNTIMYAVVVILVILAGVGTGWKLSGTSTASETSTTSAPVTNVTGNEAGVSDESTFKDTAEGTLEKGGIDGDGTHKLLRNAGPTKDIALTSTVIDLDSYVGKKVQIWGQTLTAQKATWLMDVGKLKVVTE